MLLRQEMDEREPSSGPLCRDAFSVSVTAPSLALGSDLCRASVPSCVSDLYFQIQFDVLCEEDTALHIFYILLLKHKDLHLLGWPLLKTKKKSIGKDVARL